MFLLLLGIFCRQKAVTLVIECFPSLSIDLEPLAYIDACFLAIGETG